MNRSKAMVLALLAGSVLLSGCWWWGPPDGPRRDRDRHDYDRHDYDRHDDRR
jgi:hypothetical protein